MTGGLGQRPRNLIFWTRALISGADETGNFSEMNDTTQAPSPETPTPGDSHPREPDGFAVIEKLNAKITEQNAEIAEHKDRALRALADYDNMRRRSEREAADARTYALTGFARDLLSVVDNLTRALESVPAEARAAAEGTFKSLVEGVELTARELQSTLGRHGVKKLEPQGEKFDPNFHQAMFEVPDETLPAGTVTQVVQSGWKIGERVLRPALVGVSKGGPRSAPKAE
jgi:molecular chaperone GrpE